MIDFNKLKKIVLDNESFLLTTHVNPDADAIGSEIALANLLKRLNKQVHIINHSETPYNLEFLDKNKQINKFSIERHSEIIMSCDILVALDFNRSERLVSMRDLFINSPGLRICIDHHQNPEDFTDEMFLGIEHSATAEIIFDFIQKSELVSLDSELAIPIYAAIMTDTGSFRFERTTPDLHIKVAELLKEGADPGGIYDKIYDQSKFSKIKLLGKALNSVNLTSDNQIAYMKLTQKDFIEINGIESDTDGFVNHSLSVENVRLGLLFIELKSGFKVSFRSKGNLPVNKLAAEFGGGGHTNAAGARFHDHNMEEMIPRILEMAKSYINKYK